MLESPGKKKVAVVTGAAGQDGSYLCELLLDKGYASVVGVVRRSGSPKLDNLRECLRSPRFAVEHADLTDSASVRGLLARHLPDELYNLAAQSHVGASFSTPEATLAVNATGVLNCLEAIRAVSPATRLYQAGTSEMFGSSPPPQSESTPMLPGSPYACAKLCAHTLVKNYRDAYGMYACSGILFNHESPRRGEDFVTRKITLAAARIAAGLQTELRLGNMDARRDWGYAPEYVDAMWRLLQLPASCYVAFGMTIGTPTDEPLTRGRMPLAGVLHREVYEAAGTATVLVGADVSMRDWAARCNEQGGYQGRLVNLDKGWTDRMAQLWGERSSYVAARANLVAELKSLGFDLR